MENSSVQNWERDLAKFLNHHSVFPAPFELVDFLYSAFIASNFQSDHLNFCACSLSHFGASFFSRGEIEWKFGSKGNAGKSTKSKHENISQYILKVSRHLIEIVINCKINFTPHPSPPSSNPFPLRTPDGILILTLQNGKEGTFRFSDSSHFDFD